MKNSNKCPKCNSTEIYTDEGLIKRGDRCTIPVTGWRSFYISVYVCLNCGFTEEYMANSELNDKKMIEKVKEKWKKAGE